MYNKFEALSAEKQMRIINAALREFSGKLYKNASTDTIANEAEISKGALFNYFGSKRKLYMYIYNFAFSNFVGEMFERFDKKNSDPVARLYEIAEIKMDILAKHPDISDFIVNAFLNETDSEIRSILDQQTPQSREKLYQEAMMGLDYSVFKNDYNAVYFMKIINWIIQGFSNEIIERVKREPDKLQATDLFASEMHIYLDIVRDYFYKKDIRDEKNS